MTRDRHGNPLSGADAKAAEAYDTAVAQVGREGVADGRRDRARRDRRGPPRGRAGAACGRAESSHLAALTLLVDGRWDDSAIALERHSARWPKDILALQAGHLADFFRANARTLRDRIARALPHWSADTPGGAVVLGMYAFGLEEMGDYARAGSPRSRVRAGGTAG